MSLLVAFKFAERSAHYWSLAASLKRRGKVHFETFISIQYRFETLDWKYYLGVSECPRYVEWGASRNGHNSESNTQSILWSTPFGPDVELGLGFVEAALYRIGSTVEPQSQILNLVHSHWDRFSSAPSIAL